MRSASLPGLRVAHRHATFVRSSRDAQLREMQEYKQQLAQRLSAASEAGEHGRRFILGCHQQAGG